ncbi:unnamed protein product [Caenorhabditis angaria]|uniref:Ground-like domain-containing protein n=1 Tax=Caenorhabditis angaria TaxID=860376 RepID=A0A9P1IV54_9PELO|nr:unnamed protein product [Caenorhabditis angaria]
MPSSITFLTIFLAIFVCYSEACPGLFGMGGGGGGCGCMPPAPPPPMCGCGGRKKRSLPEKPTFYGIAGKDQDVLCNTPELKEIIRQNMKPDQVDSSKALQNALEAKKLQRYIVVCSEHPFVYTTRIDTAYCGEKKFNHYCHVFAI